MNPGAAVYDAWVELPLNAADHVFIYTYMYIYIYIQDRNITFKLSESFT